jgi:enoyl-CoA hydratase/carnithine racemase
VLTAGSATSVADVPRSEIFRSALVARLILSADGHRGVPATQPPGIVALNRAQTSNALDAQIAQALGEAIDSLENAILINSTELVAGMTVFANRHKGLVAEAGASSPPGRAAQAEDLARAVCFLASEACS